MFKCPRHSLWVSLHRRDAVGELNSHSRVGLIDRSIDRYDLFEIASEEENKYDQTNNLSKQKDMNID